jgi:hypothetical protein
MGKRNTSRRDDFAPPKYDSHDLPQAGVIGRLAEKNGLMRDTGSTWEYVASNVRSVMDFGAVVDDGAGTAAATNYAAIMAAVVDAYAAGASSGVAADNGQVYMPPGGYSISATIDLTNYPGVTLFGAGTGQYLPPVSGTRLYPTGDFPAVRLGNTSGVTINRNPVHHYLHDFAIWGTGSGTSQHGIVIAAPETASYQATFNVLERLLIVECGGDAIQFTDNAWQNTARDIQIYGCGGHGISVGDESQGLTLQSIKVQACAGDGIKFAAGSFGIYGGSVNDCEITGCVGWGINVSNIGTRGIKIDGCYLENNDAGQLNNAGAATSVFGGQFFQQAAAVDEANVDIVRWSGNRGGIWGVFTTGDCRYIFNLEGSITPTVMGCQLGATASGAYFNLDNCTGPIITDENNRLIAPVLLARSASGPKVSALDTTNNLEAVLQAGDTEGLAGTSTDHNFYLTTNNTRRLTIDNAGLVGIGTGSPSTLLHVSGTTTPTVRVTDTTGSLSVDTSAGDTEGLIGTATNHAFYVQTNGTRRMTVDAAKNVVYVGDSSNADMTAGLTLNQGAADDKIFARKSSDVAHAVTNQAETDTYGFDKKIASTGGLDIVGLEGAATVGLRLTGIGITTDGLRGVGREAAVVIDGKIRDGSGPAATGLGADKNILAVGTSGSMQFFLDSDGDSHQNVGTAWTTFDTHDDVALLNQLTAHVMQEGDPLRGNFRDWLETNRTELEKLKLVSFNEDGQHFVNMSRLTMLLVGAVRQVGDRIGLLEQKLALLGAG